jgi:hypothetical protein
MQKSIIKTSLLIGFSFFASDVFSQQTLNVAANSAQINGMTFDYSIGEMTIVSTERNANLIVTQGLLQPHGSGSVASDAPSNTTLSDLSDNIKVYPNPTQNILFVETYETQVADYNYQLMDGLGKVVLNKEGQTQIGLNKFTLDLQSLAAGTYYLMLRKPNPTGQLENYSFKIQKLN